MEGVKPSVRRCAVYTRKSSEEGLEQDFNSLHAQREACEAFIKSQAGEGWRLVRTAYDDGGLSGGTMDRPALTRLLDDIRHGLIDVIVVYKVDRLTRSLADFAKMVEIFDAQGVSFVAVTQQFNTTTSMGRLTLNVLLSFAQFEREVTGERIRDKFAASKRKGMWMGGVPPLGYDVSERRLIVNETEAVTVREIFERYLVLGSVRLLRNDLERRSVVSKVRVSRTGIKTGGRSFSRGALYELLSNPIYIGEVRHKQERHPGQHEAILEREPWERVQHHLREQAAQHRMRPTKASPSPLAGKLFDENGAPLYAQGAMKDGRRYRYYVSRELVRGSGEQARAGWRLPAPELERAVVGAARSILDDKQTVLAELQESGIGLWEVDQIFEMTSACSGRLLAETESAAALVEVIERVQLTAEDFRIVLKISVHRTSQAMVRRSGIRPRSIAGRDRQTGTPREALCCTSHEVGVYSAVNCRGRGRRVGSGRSQLTNADEPPLLAAIGLEGSGAAAGVPTIACRIAVPFPTSRRPHTQSYDLERALGPVPCGTFFD
jgi:DNA invertase Pin-like site-specific DNA recombinase